MPTDPRAAVGTCAALGVTGPAFNGTYQSWQTGGAGAGTIAATATLAAPWPPATISNVDGAAVPGTLLPVYTPTGTVATLPPPSITSKAAKSVSAGDGWFDAQDTSSAPATISGCDYPDAWDALTVPLPTSCGSLVTTTSAEVLSTPALTSVVSATSSATDSVITGTPAVKRSPRRL